MSIRAYLQHTPVIAQRVYIDPDATVIGQVRLDEEVSIWPGARLRGDVNHIHVGAQSNIQDNAVLHVTHDGRYSPGGIPLLIGRGVTVGHSAVLHACSIGDFSLIGMGAVVLDGARIDDHVLVAAGSVVAPGKHLDRGSLWRGNPARRVRDLTTEEIEMLEYSAKNYVTLMDDYLAVDG